MILEQQYSAETVLPASAKLGVCSTVNIYSATLEVYEIQATSSGIVYMCVCMYICIYTHTPMLPASYVCSDVFSSFFFFLCVSEMRSKAKFNMVFPSLK